MSSSHPVRYHQLHESYRRETSLLARPTLAFPQRCLEAVRGARTSSSAPGGSEAVEGGLGAHRPRVPRRPEPEPIAVIELSRQRVC